MDNVSTWPEQKRMAYGFAYRATAIGFIGQGDDDLGWHSMEKALIFWPSLLERVDTFYELVCKDQPRGYRGQAKLLDIRTNAEELFNRLDTMLSNDSGEITSRRDIIYGNANLAVSMLYDQAGDWPQARNHLLRAVRNNRALLRDAGVRRRLAKVALSNPRLLKAIRSAKEPAKKRSIN